MLCAATLRAGVVARMRKNTKLPLPPACLMKPFANGGRTWVIQRSSCGLEQQRGGSSFCARAKCVRAT